MVGPEEERRAVLIWIGPHSGYLEEMRELSRSAGYVIVAEVSQNRSEPDPKYYLGQGKLDELKEFDVGYLITVSDLKPSQMFNMSDRTGFRIVDRTRIILDLFQKRASTTEAKLQVEIADLRYQVPVLREYIHQGKLSERPGFMAGGEYAVDYYYEMIRRRMAQIKEKLEVVRGRRGRKRSLRRRKGVHLVSIAGYTNAGKSTLLNGLLETNDIGKRAETGDLMFTTIGTTTRKMRGGRNCLVTDTVGFIRELPPWLVEGFMSTLEEIFEADVVLLVMDASEGVGLIRDKLEETLSILRGGGTEGHVLVVANKIDLVPSAEEREEKVKMIEELLISDHSRMAHGMSVVSASTGEGIDGLISLIHEQLPPLSMVEFILGPGMGADRVISELRRSAQAEFEYLEDGRIRIEAYLEKRWVGSYSKRVREAGGEVVVDHADS
jgi:GTP-binding protein HflX